jgi:hypothetical protein
MIVPVAAWPDFSSAPRTLREEDVTHGTWVEELKLLAHTTRTYTMNKILLKTIRHIT